SYSSSRPPRTTGRRPNIRHAHPSPNHLVVDFIHLRRRERHATLHPPSEQRNERTRQRVPGCRPPLRRHSPRPGLPGQPLLDPPRKVPPAQLHGIVNLPRRDHGRIKLTHIGHMEEEFPYRRNTLRNFTTPGELRGHQLEEFLHVTHQQIVFIAVVGVEGRASHTCAVEHVLDGNGGERLL